MDLIIDFIDKANSTINGFVWGPIMIFFMLAIGIYFTIKTRFFQITKFNYWIKETFFSIFSSKSVTEKSSGKAINQFQSMATALAGTLGTGSIAGVATAIVLGGSGAIFWMWVSAFFGMMTAFAENVLGIKYRYKDDNGEWIGGAMVYLEKGVKSKTLAVLFAFFCTLASFGIGNMTQSNSIALALENSFNINVKTTGVVLMVLLAVVIIGGIKRIATVTEKVVPTMAVLYILGCFVVLVSCYKAIPKVFLEIVENAFSVKSVGGGFLGYQFMRCIKFGVARGIFSNEAGLGSSVMAHACCDVKEPVKQGMWAVFEVFFDTIIVCTITAFVILVTGKHLTTNLDGVALTAEAFSSVLGGFGSYFVSVSIILFAFATLLSWSYYGEKSAVYIFGKKVIPIYRLLFLIFVMVGCVSNLKLVWSISDTFNGLMAIPNLIGVSLLSKVVIEETKKYFRKNEH